MSTVLDLIYWRDVKKTAVVFGSMLFILLSLAIYSVLTVIAYLSLAILAVTLSFRVYKNIMQAVQKSGDGHPFKEYLECDIELNDQKTQKVVKLILKHTNATVQELRRLFLIEDLVDSLKFGLLLWVLTYIGSWFNGMTIIINSVVIIFTLPKIYETYKVQIDNYLAMARSQFNKILQQVQSKLPFLKKKAKAQ
uniref:Reticulon-like protein n=1 Tax=Octopus bimaculoides TaxID=37653 RepID=A0A0L8HVD6_OCTBM